VLAATINRVRARGEAPSQGDPRGGYIYFFLQQDASHGLNATQNPTQPVRWQQSDRFSQPKATGQYEMRKPLLMPHSCLCHLERVRRIETICVCCVTPAAAAPVRAPVPAPGVGVTSADRLMRLLKMIC